jgi:lysophospholipase L1-like esterase
VETITVSQAGGGSSTVDVGFYVDGSHTCNTSQNPNGTFGSGMSDLDAVATWVNTGSSALDFIEPTASLQPAWRTNVIAGQPVVRYDSGDMSYAGAVADWPLLNNGSDFTVEAVWVAGIEDPNIIATLFGTRASGGVVTGFALGSDDRAGSSRDDTSYHVMGNGTTTNFAYIGPSNSVSQRNWHLQSTILDDDAGAGADAFHYVDNVLLSSSIISAAYQAGNPSQQFRIGMSTIFAPDVFRVTVYASALTATQRGINEAVDEWALGGSFPVVATIFDPANTWLFVGDSLTAGSGGITPWVDKLQAYAPTVDFVVSAEGGINSAAILARWRASDTPPPARIFVLGGINDVGFSQPASVALTSLQAIYSEAKALGVEVIALSTPGVGTSVLWSAPEQIEIEAMNAAILADTNVDFAIDMYTAMQDPADLDAILPAYRLADGVHPSEAGTTFMADTIATALGLP